MIFGPSLGQTSAFILLLFTQPPKTPLNMMAKVIIRQDHKYVLNLILPQSKFSVAVEFLANFGCFCAD